MVGTLYLIRHGSTEADGVKRYKGTMDVPLSPEGEEEMKRTFKFISSTLEKSGKQLDTVYCSGLKRALRSAEIITANLGLRPVVVEKLHERHFGLWEGLTFEEIEERWPGEFKAWAQNPLKHRPKEGESTLEVSERVNGALDGILDNHDGQTIAVVAHGGINRVILCRFLGVPLEHIFRIEQDHAAVSIIEFYDGYPVVKLLNWRGF